MITIRCTRSRGPRGFWNQKCSPRPGERCRYHAKPNGFNLRKKFSIRSLLLYAIPVAIASSVIALAVREKQRPRNEDEQFAVAFLVCDYLDANQKQWPPNWNALKPFHDTRFPDENFTDLQNHVFLDFTVDTTNLLETCVNTQLASEFKPIRSKVWDNESFEENPNSIILRHLGRVIMY